MKRHFTLIMALLVSLFSALPIMADDADLVQIPLETSGAEVGGFINPANATVNDGYTTYTTNGNLSIVFKMLNVDVADCDYILFKFANPTPSGLKYAFWNHDNKVADLPSGITEFKYDWSTDEDCRVSNGIIPEITLLTMWAEGVSCDLIGVYKHKTSSAGDEGGNSGNEGGNTDPQEPAVTYTAPILGADFTAINQEQDDVEGGVVTIATKEVSENYITYTTKDNVCVIEKTKNVNVAGCDYVVFKFVEAIPAGIQFACGEGSDCTPIDEGSTEYIHYLTDAEKTAGVLPQLSLVTIFAQAGKVVKISGIYLHVAPVEPVGPVDPVEPIFLHRLAVTDGEAVTAETGTAYYITYTRNFKKAESWQSLYLPFAINMEEVDQTDIAIAQFDADKCEVDEDGVVTLTINKVTEGTIAANTPLFITTATTGSKEITAIGVTLEEADESNHTLGSTDISIYGVLTQVADNIAGSYVMSGGSLKTVGSSTDKLPINRWYMQVSAANPANVRFNFVGLDIEDATAIKSVLENTVNGATYTIDGRAMKSAPAKGMYIQNGKKYIAK